jgi:hypothetical protein
MRSSLKSLAFLAIALLPLGSAFGVEGEGDGSDPQTDAIINKYLSATQEQQSALRGASMNVDIDAEVPKLQKKGKLQALRNISKLGKITYNALGFSGDKTIKNEVIARYLTAETQNDQNGDMSISPMNYKFKYRGLQNHDGKDVYVLAVSPRHKRVGLFKGEVWMDQKTYMPVRESGKFVKSPSIFLKKIEFVRTYEVKNGVAVPQHIESKVMTRLFGPVTLNIDFTNFSKDTTQDVASTAAASIQ